MSKRWTESDLKKLNLPIIEQGMLRNISVPGPEKPVRDPNWKKPAPVNVEKMKALLRAAGLQFEEEYRFCPGRKFRADIAFLEPHVKLIVEYEGIHASAQSGKSRHTTITGYSNDVVKYNFATKLGWKILRYHAGNYQDCVKDVLEVINNS